jgi:gas vesicle protein GvpL/GvpF
MVTYLYCVLSSAGAEGTPTLVGVAGAPVRILALGELEAWVATVHEASISASGPTLGAQAALHNEVVAAAMSAGRTPLPARFGSHFADDRSCIATLRGRAPQFRDALTRLAGSVEMSVLIVPKAWGPPAESSLMPDRDAADAGRRYLEMVRQRARRAEANQVAVDAVMSELRDKVRGVTHGESRGRGTTAVLSIAHLLRREDVARYREALGTLPESSGFRLIVAGPRAPYSFVGSEMFMTGHDSSSPDGNG